MTDTITTRIDNVTGIPEKYLGTVLPAPPSVKIELTSRCNFACQHCSHRLKEKTMGDMDIDLYKRVVKEFRDAGVEELGLFYIGESFLCKWLPDAIAYAKEVGFPYVFLTTNGSLADPYKVEACMKAGLDSLKWSYNHSSDTQFRAITNCAPEKFEIIKAHIKEAWKIREKNNYKTKLYASSIKYDGQQLKDMEQSVGRIRPYVDEHYWLPLLSFGDQARINGKKSAVGNPGRLDNMRNPLPCWAVFREGHVTHEGLLSACCFDSSNKWIMADLKEVGFMDGWNSEAYQTLRKAHLDGDVHGTACESCIHGEE